MHVTPVLVIYPIPVYVLAIISSSTIDELGLDSTSANISEDARDMPGIYMTQSKILVSSL